jgi:nitrile hydratase accessory protein
MSTAVLLDVDGVAAPPRSNGELVFAEPWQSRAFGLVMALHESGAFTWDEFRDHLIAVIGAWEQDNSPGEGYSYYRCWLQALEQVLDSKELVTAHDLVTRTTELAARPAGYDHGHDHGHDHGDHSDHSDHGHGGHEESRPS